MKSWLIIATLGYDCAIVNQNWNRTILGNIGPIMPIVSRRVFSVLTKVGYWGRIRDSKFKKLSNVYDHCAVTVARILMIFHITTDKCMYTGLITDSKTVQILHFHILSALELSGHRKFERLPTEPWPLDQNV